MNAGKYIIFGQDVHGGSETHETSQAETAFTDEGAFVIERPSQYTTSFHSWTRTLRWQRSRLRASTSLALHF
jgi:hypothetical protein